MQPPSLETWERVQPPGPGPGGELVLLDPIVLHTVLGALPRDGERLCKQHHCPTSTQHLQLKNALKYILSSL